MPHYTKYDFNNLGFGDSGFDTSVINVTGYTGRLMKFKIGKMVA